MINFRITIDLTNLDELQTRLRKNILKKAIRAGGKEVLQALRSRAPRDTGTLAKSLTTKVDSKKGEDVVIGVIGVRSGYKRTVKGQVKQPSRYAHLSQRKQTWLAATGASSLPSGQAKMQQVIASEIDAVLSK